MKQIKIFVFKVSEKKADYIETEINKFLKKVKGDSDIDSYFEEGHFICTIIYKVTK